MIIPTYAPHDDVTYFQLATNSSRGAYRVVYEHHNSHSSTFRVEAWDNGWHHVVTIDAEDVVNLEEAVKIAHLILTGDKHA